ncbi:MAG: hypothetical protein B6244_07025 [Candidatus Cloacimonetes bacterium 4572_55]|nr:MAG: hypothetical protein B6244_07025 [Candidatus Cloacimonetes bacterium 4572_55]
MYVSNLALKNWRNFSDVDIDLAHRVFIVGPNACGKSNLLDVFRFLRDIAKDGGGLKEAVNTRGGVSKIRSLSARSRPDVEIHIHLEDETDPAVHWTYAIGFTQIGGGIASLNPKLRYERVKKGEKTLLDRPNDQDKEDGKLLEYTYLEQPNSNRTFREIADFLKDIQYLNVAPQLLRESASFLRADTKEDFYGHKLIEKMNGTNRNTRKAYLKKIESVLTKAIPQLKNLELIKDNRGVPHLQATYQHWRARGARQWEDQFSDGTLRLIGFLWSLLNGSKPLLLEEPELSLHPGLVELLAGVIARLQRRTKLKILRQVILSTHSYELLSDPGIAPEEILMLIPKKEGTEVINTASDEEIKSLLMSGMTAGEAVLPAISSVDSAQLMLEF